MKQYSTKNRDHLTRRKNQLTSTLIRVVRHGDPEFIAATHRRLDNVDDMLRKREESDTVHPFNVYERALAAR